MNYGLEIVLKIEGYVANVSRETFLQKKNIKENKN